MKYIIEDSSFVVALLYSADSLHNRALDIFQEILQRKDKVRIIMPTPVMFETMFALMRNQIPRQTVETKLWNMLMIENVLNYPILETSALRLAKKTESLFAELPSTAMLPANDLMILSVASDFDTSCVLTFDEGMKKYAKVHSDIFCITTDEAKKQFCSFLDN